MNASGFGGFFISSKINPTNAGAWFSLYSFSLVEMECAYNVRIMRIKIGKTTYRERKWESGG